MDCDLKINGQVLLNHQLIDPGLIFIDQGKITWSGPEIDAPDLKPTVTINKPANIFVPGYIDLHVHGAKGYDAVDGTDEALNAICKAHLAHGTTALCPTILTNPPQIMLKALEAVANSSKKQILGSHLEGPFLSPQKAGAQPREHLLLPDLFLLDELIAAAGTSLRIVTLAPELPGAMALIERLVERDIIVSIGHTNATFKEAQAAIAAGCTLSTHIFNGMRSLHHREPGVLGAILTEPEVTTEVIADGIHLAGPILKLLFKLKAPENFCLITDCTAALEAKPGAARLGDHLVHVANGAVRLPDGTLAGSCLTLDHAVANLIALGQVSLAEAVYAATQVPAKLLGLPQLGSLEVGKQADIVMVDQQLNVLKVYLAGCEQEI